MNNYRYLMLSPDELLASSQLLGWWTEMMNREPHMLGESPEAVLASLQAAYIVFDGFQPIASSGLFKARTKMGTQLHYADRQVIEMGSSVVEPAYRGQGIGKRIMKRCIQLAWQIDSYPVSVSTNPIVQHIFVGMGGVSMDNDHKLADLRSSLCLCEQFSSNCKLCPLSKRGGWVFPPPYKRLDVIKLHPNVDQDLIDGFISVYREAFAEPPWLESYTADQVEEEVVRPHLPHYISIVKVDGKAIGLATAYGLAEGDVSGCGVVDFIDTQRHRLPRALEKTLYLSELAVLSKYRRLGIGTLLAEDRFLWGRSKRLTAYLMRTAQANSFSQPLYEQLGARVLDGVVQTVSPAKIKTASEKRIFLWGEL
ncbi:MAG: GNAT family N-acetyltransferase [bacterium]|nr:GNAT family N-acetyltransferase [bacterium]